MTIAESRIRPLSPNVANQIAAGEVIENPASVVKELLENALDASATQIAIDIGFGGLNQIKISDNGIGILADDLPLAIAPHATSKLTQLEDLSTLTSMGFRGEALASVASVSRISLSSRPAGQAHAMMLRFEGEQYVMSPCARSQGTTVDVCDLFYNAPVRRRFLKSARSEFLAIEQVVKRFALSAPHLTLVLRHNGKVTLELPSAQDAQSLRTRVQRIMGKSFIDQAIEIETERAGMSLKGWISHLSYQRSQNDKQWLYLNQRMVKDKLIQHAFKQAYEDKLFPGRYPSCLLYLSMPTADVDVNVHPTKHEVRFQQPRLVHDFIRSQIAEALIQADAQYQQAFPLEPMQPQTTNDFGFTFPDPQPTSPWVRPVEMRELMQKPERPMMLKGNCSPLSTSRGLSAESIDGARFLEPADKPWDVGEEVDARAVTLKETYSPRPQYHVWKATVPRTSPWTILNQQFGLFIHLQQAYIFNIVLAQQQRCLWHIEHSSLPLPSRPLLVPVSIEHQLNDTSILEHTFPLWQSYGISLELHGARLVLRTLPVSMPQLDVKALLAEVVKASVQETDIPNMLAACQLSDVYQLSAEDKDVLGEFILQQLEQPLTPNWCKHLTIERCQELLRV